MMILGLCHASGLLAAMPRLVQAPFSAGKGLVLPTILLLFAGHALCDYPLQADFLAKGKNRHTAFPCMAWWQLMLAHCLIHAGMVLLITGSVWMALVELGIHYATDCAKCEGKISFNQDQAIHYGCKLLWAVLTVYA